MKINILTMSTPYFRGNNDYYPLLKWQKQLKSSGFEFNYIGNIENINIGGNQVWIDYKIIQSNFKHRGEDYYERVQIINLIEGLRRTHDKVYLFDTGDGTGSRCFWLTPHVDIHIKKQVLKDKKKYTGKSMTDSYMVWLPDRIVADVFKETSSYRPCPEDQLHKLKVGWNIGYVDYRSLPFSKFYSSALIPEWITKGPKFKAPNKDRMISASYRGELHSEAHYNYQRKKVIETLKGIKRKCNGIIVGNKICKREYSKELYNSKAVISPYGWGELCYRDFEAFLSGCLLIKPDMSHLHTFPDMYLPNETYLPIDWDIGNLSSTMEEVLINYDTYIRIAQQAQEKFCNVIEDFELFYAKIEQLTQIK